MREMSVESGEWRVWLHVCSYEPCHRPYGDATFDEVDPWRVCPEILHISVHLNVT